MLNAREPKIVNGPQILDKYVGESEANIRKLFAEAEEEEKRVLKSILFSQISQIPFFSSDLIVVYISSSSMKLMLFVKLVALWFVESFFN